MTLQEEFEIVVLCEFYGSSSADAVGGASDDGNAASLDGGVQIVCDRRVIYLVGGCADEAGARSGRRIATGAFRKHGSRSWLAKDLQ